MAVTIRDVSKHCGLSVSAVSKALNNYPDVSKETRERVLKAVQQTGYHPNALARGLRSNRTYNLGVILDDEMRQSLQHTYFVTMLNGFTKEAERQGYDVTLINHNIGGKELSYLDHCRYRNVDGVCLLCVDFYSVEILNLVQSDLPLVTIDHLFSGRDCVLSDNKSGMRDVLAYVIEMGHRRVAFIHGSHSSVTDARLAAFYETAHQYGLAIPQGFLINNRSDASLASEAIQRLLSPSHEAAPTCILMMDDYSALSAMDTIRNMGLRIPDDVSIAGYDGMPLIQKMHPRLTTVRQEGEEVGRLAAMRLIARIGNPQEPVRSPDIVSCSLIPGGTVRRV